MTQAQQEAIQEIYDIVMAQWNRPDLGHIVVDMVVRVNQLLESSGLIDPATGKVREAIRGTYNCDICGLGSPHHHDEELVEIERLARPAFERTIVPRKQFARLEPSPGSGYLDRETQSLWQHFLSGWFRAKGIYVQSEPTADPYSKLRAAVEKCEVSTSHMPWCESHNKPPKECDCGHEALRTALDSTK